jgi:hypothetical protein
MFSNFAKKKKRNGKENIEKKRKIERDSTWAMAH